jgi:hypothetical protein
MTTFMKDVLIVDNDDTEESKLIMKEYRFCLAAAMHAILQEVTSDSQGPDNTSFDEEQSVMVATWQRRTSVSP